MLHVLFTYTAKGARPKLVVYFNRSSNIGTTIVIEPNVETEIQVPIEAALTVFQSIAAYDSGWGQVANVLEGKGYITNNQDEPGTVELRNRLRPGTISGHVQYQFTGTTSDYPFPPAVIEVGEAYHPDKKEQMTALYNTNISWWYGSKLRPKTALVGRIHASRFNRMMLPGWTFMLDESSAESDPDVFESAIKNVLLRRNYQGTLSKESAQFKSIVAAEAVQAIANMIQYTTDYEYSTSNADAREEYDEFISSARNDYLRAGDCEDLAKEMHMLIREIQNRSWEDDDSLTATCAIALRNYMSAIVLGSMMAAKVGMEDAKPTGHAFLALFPKVEIQEKLVDGFKIKGTDANEYEPLRLLILDGTNLKPVEFGDILFPQPAIHSTHAHKHQVFREAKIPDADMRVRTYIPKLSYIHCVSILVNDIVTIPESNEPEQHVYQFYFRQGNSYGVEFKNMADKDVSIVPCMIPTDEHLDLCRMGLELEPPIQAYKATGEHAIMRTLKPWQDKTSVPIQLFIQSVDEAILHIVEQYKELFDGLYFREERFADGVYGYIIIVCL